jgi:lactoylglutathione lyase
MPHELTKLTPNLIVSNVERSLAFYRDVLGFTCPVTVPDASPFVFAIVQHGPVEIFLNAPEPAVTGVEALHAALKDKVNVVMPLEKKWYGSTEFAFEDPDGYLITYAERPEGAGD